MNNYRLWIKFKKSSIFKSNRKLVQIDVKLEELKQEFKEDPLILLKKDQLNAIIEMIPTNDTKLNLDFKQDLKVNKHF